MPDDSAGNYSPPPGYLAVTGQTVLASQHNPPIEDSAAAMSRRYMRDGRAPMLGNVPMNGYRATGAGDAQGDQDYVTLAQVQTLIAALSTIPTGTIVHWPSGTIPAGWLALSGQEVSRETYAALYAFAAASSIMAASQGAKTAGQFGPGNGSTTFTLPNLYADSGYFLRAMSSGRTLGSTQADEIKSHDHNATFSGDPVAAHSHATDGPAGGGNTFGGGSSGVGQTAWQTEPAGGHTPSGDVTVTATGGTETRPKNIAYHVLIKT